MVVSDRLTSTALNPIRPDGSASAAAPAEQGCHVVSVGRVHKPIEPAPDDGLEWLADERGEAGVRIQDVADAGQDEGALLHLLDKRAVRFFGAVQRVDLVAAWRLDDKRIDFAMTNRAKQFLGFRKANLQHRRLFGGM